MFGQVLAAAGWYALQMFGFQIDDAGGFFNFILNCRAAASVCHGIPAYEYVEFNGVGSVVAGGFDQGVKVVVAERFGRLRGF